MTTLLVVAIVQVDALSIAALSKQFYLPHKLLLHCLHQLSPQQPKKPRLSLQLHLLLQLKCQQQTFQQHDFQLHLLLQLKSQQQEVQRHNLQLYLLLQLKSQQQEVQLHNLQLYLLLQFKFHVFIKFPTVIFALLMLQCLN